MNLSGIIYETVRPEPVEGIFTVAKSLDKACPEHGEGLSPNGSNASGQSRLNLKKINTGDKNGQLDGLTSRRRLQF
jgi:hypothetical protein